MNYISYLNFIFKFQSLM